MGTVCYCATCAHNANTGLHIETERFMNVLIHAGQISTDQGLHFYTPNTVTRLCAHLLAKWMIQRDARLAAEYAPDYPVDERDQT